MKSLIFVTISLISLSPIILHAQSVDVNHWKYKNDHYVKTVAKYGSITRYNKSFSSNTCRKSCTTDLVLDFYKKNLTREDILMNASTWLMSNLTHEYDEILWRGDGLYLSFTLRYPGISARPYEWLGVNMLLQAKDNRIRIQVIDQIYIGSVKEVDPIPLGNSTASIEIDNGKGVSARFPIGQRVVYKQRHMGYFTHNTIKYRGSHVNYIYIENRSEFPKFIDGLLSFITKSGSNSDW